ncbi:xylose isomerase [Erysipelothrix urinaevulpis]|uniref:xylose isomerase n=1 Tax=Erysipelothrix urinaevulpis TaxID=2683717 RepID=UPI0013573D79|nr:xylose isomerase [Erysipelothrix urinaevulpis]
MYFDKIDKVKFEGVDSTNPYAYRYYDKEKLVLGKRMGDHLPFAIAYWHTMTNGGDDPFGDSVNKRNWYGDNELDTAKKRVDAFFELLVKLDVEYFCFHDVDIAPQGNNLQEFMSNLDVMTDIIKEKMDETGIKLLWNTANVFTHPRFVNGAATSPNADVYAYSAAQVKKGLDISKKLNGKNYVFWGGREGYETLLNTDMDLEEKNLASFYKMAIDYAKSIDHLPQFLLEPKPKEPTKHQYDFDAATTLSFLQKYDLMEYFKLNLEANHATLAGHTFEHEIRVAAINNSLGSIDANQGDLLLGWDVDEFPTNVADTTLAVYEIIRAGGLGVGGINFDAKVRRSSFEMEDLVLAHIAGMDTYARALLSVEKIIEDKFFEKILEKRYHSYNNGIGKKIIDGETNILELYEYALELNEIENDSSHIEYVKSKLNDYLV